VAWWRLFGFPCDPRLWVGFLVHDLGYLGRPNVEGAGSEGHVELGGRIMTRLFGKQWGSLCFRHSRYWCHVHGQPYSKLCVADKLAFVLTPGWLYLPMVKASGELREYMAASQARQAGGKFSEVELCLIGSRDPRVWLEGLKSYTRRWVAKHRERHLDTWTAPRGVVKLIRI